MKKLLLIAVVAGAGFCVWKRWQSLQAEQALVWASGTDPVD